MTNKYYHRGEGECVEPELWEDVAGYVGVYMVSNIGRVKNITTGKILTGNTTCYGYSRVALTKSGKKKDFFVHRLVAVAFIKNPKNKPFVNHIDSNRINNNCNNLEWVTSKENIAHGIKYGNGFSGGESHGNSKLKESDVRFIRSADLPFVDLAKKFNVSVKAIKSVKNRIRWKHI